MLGKEFINGGERSRPKEAAVGRQRRGVGRLDHAVMGPRDQGLFLPCGVAPQDECNRVGLRIDHRDDAVGETLPTFAMVTTWFTTTNSESCVE